MAWLAVDKDGREEIHSIMPIRHSILCNNISLTSQLGVRVDNTNYGLKFMPAEWLSESEPCDCGDIINSAIALPKGSIKKLIGKELTWEDEPYYLKEGI